MKALEPVPLTSAHNVERFSCGEEELNDWLRRFALGAQAAGTSRVYVTTLEDEQTVVGFYSLAASQVLPVEATSRMLKGEPLNRPQSAILLARFGVDQQHQGQGLGRSLLADAMARSVTAADSVGARVLLVHAKHDRAKEFYLRFGFEESASDPLHLVLLLKDIRRSRAKRRSD